MISSTTLYKSLIFFSSFSSHIIIDNNFLNVQILLHRRTFHNKKIKSFGSYTLTVIHSYVTTVLLMLMITTLLFILITILDDLRFI